MTAPLLVQVMTYNGSSAGQPSGRPVVAVLQLPTGAAPDGTITDLVAKESDPPHVKLMQDPAPPGIVRECGEALCRELKTNAQIRAAIETLSAGGVRTPIYIRFLAPAENLAWEALWDDRNMAFLGLSAGWPIARIGSRSPDPTVAWERLIEPDLRVLLVLAAAPKAPGAGTVDALQEWNQIWPAFASVDRVRVHVLTCQESVIDAIEALNDSRITCELIIGAAHARLSTVVRRFAPNIIHFFCHGSSDPTPRLEIANVADYDSNSASASILLAPPSVADFGKQASVCLITLNCCRGGRAGSGGRSLAHYLSESGVPAVVAMRENVSASDAHVFAGTYYRDLIAGLTRILPSETDGESGNVVTIPELVWVDAMLPSRQAILANGRVPEDQPVWTLPVVYVQPGGLRLQARPRQDAAVLALRALKDIGIASLSVRREFPQSLDQIETEVLALKRERREAMTLLGSLRAVRTPRSFLNAAEAEADRIDRRLLDLSTEILRSAVEELESRAFADAYLMSLLSRERDHHAQRVTALGNQG